MLSGRVFYNVHTHYREQLVFVFLLHDLEFRPGDDYTNMGFVQSHLKEALPRGTVSDTTWVKHY
jgi:hypothetical protein